MQIVLQQLFPTYLNADRQLTSEVWGKEIAFEKGEYIKIVAPSGSGKTSLVHFLYGMRNQYSGNVKYDKKDLSEFTVEELAALRANKLSIVFQDLRLFPDQTVFDNIDIKRKLNPYHPAEKINEMARRLGLEDKLQSICKNCSYGEQQRVSIIRALVQPFDCLLLDEPFSHLDNRNAETAMELMLEESRMRGAAILFADLERVDYFPFTRIYHL
jgi:putative ABC transport system ATP-binding protein